MMMNSRIVKNEAGLTLVELIAVSVLLSLIALILYRSLGSIMTGREIVMGKRETMRVAQFVLDKMAGEFSSRVQQGLSEDSSEDVDAEAANPTRAIGRRVAVEFKNKKSSQADADSIRFVSTSGGKELATLLPNRGWVEIAYKLEEDKETRTTFTTGNDLKSFLLVRTERPSGVKNKKVLEERTLRYPLARNVVSLNFRFYKEGSWLETWEEKTLRLPEVIEITLALRAENDDIEVFRTAVAIDKGRAPR